jgi:hydroxymethylpyrimidine/phosphomethylpyrimidine kinase
VALTIAGSDSGGGAGVQADVQAMAAHGVHPTTAITSVTAQHTRGVERAVPLEPADVRAQFEAVGDDFAVGAAKTGMLATAPIVETVTEWVREASFPTVVDPVMVATSGDRLLSEAGERAYAGLVAAAALVTPNAPEAAVLTGVDPECRSQGESRSENRDVEAARRAGAELLEMGADAALLTGGHGDGETVTDVLVSDGGTETFEHPRIETAATHGSGCALSAAIAARLARGDSLSDAVGAATEFLQRATRYPLDVGRGPGTVHHLVGVRNRAARERTVEAVRAVVDELTAMDARPLIPEVGMNVVGATPYAEAVDETAAVEGRIARTLDGVRATAGVRFGASSHVARFLLGAREHLPDLRFAANVRREAATDAALAALDGPAASFDRTAEPADTDTMDWSADVTFGDDGTPPVAVFDAGAVGKEPMVRVVARDGATLLDRLRTLRSNCGRD